MQLGLCYKKEIILVECSLVSMYYVCMSHHLPPPPEFGYDMSGLHIFKYFTLLRPRVEQEDKTSDWDHHPASSIQPTFFPFKPGSWPRTDLNKSK